MAVHASSCPAAQGHWACMLVTTRAAGPAEVCCRGCRSWSGPTRWWWTARRCPAPGHGAPPAAPALLVLDVCQCCRFGSSARGLADAVWRAALGTCPCLQGLCVPEMLVEVSMSSSCPERVLSLLGVRQEPGREAFWLAALMRPGPAICVGCPEPATVPCASSARCPHRMFNIYLINTLGVGPDDINRCLQCARLLPQSGACSQLQATTFT